jgi:hypothetical protein
MERELNDVLKWFDNYARIARLYPAILAVLPAPVTVALTIDADLGVKALTSVVVMTAIGTLLVNIARSRGKAIELQLLKEWGGWPTTRMLRHSDSIIERPTKARYHAELERLCTDLKMPTIAEEASDAHEADERYRSATRQLIERRRDEQYKLVHKELAHYGFRRNLLGLKPTALWIIALAFAWTAAVLLTGLPNIHNGQDFAADAKARSPLYAAATANLVAVIVWLSTVRRDFVHQAAIEYASALLRTLDSAQPTKRKSAKPTT